MKSAKRVRTVRNCNYQKECLSRGRKFWNLSRWMDHSPKQLNISHVILAIQVAAVSDGDVLSCSTLYIFPDRARIRERAVCYSVMLLCCADSGKQNLWIDLSERPLSLIRASCTGLLGVPGDLQGSPL